MRNTPFIDSMEVKIVEVLWDVLDGVLADECQENDENLQPTRNSLAGCLYQRQSSVHKQLQIIFSPLLMLNV